MAIAHQTTQLLDGQASSTQAAVSGASNYWRHTFGVAASGGAWYVTPQWSPDGSAWYDLAGATSLADGDTETITVIGVYPHLRLDCVRTAGTLDAWVIQSDDHPTAARG